MSTIPRFVIYSNERVPGQLGPPIVDAVKGYNVVVLSSLTLEGTSDGATDWTNLTSAQRLNIKNQYNAAGIKLLISLFGSTDAPTSRSGADPVDTANAMAAWALEYNLDGVDVNYKDYEAFDTGDAESWLTTFTQQLRVNLPQNEFLVTHTALALWVNDDVLVGGGFITVNDNVGDLIDWYNVQFHNRKAGSNEYTTCSSLLTNSSGTWPDTALFQIAASGLPLNKVVIGKPVEMAGDASTGFMTPDILSTCLSGAKQEGWNAGVMGWEVGKNEVGVAASWIKSVKAKAFSQ